MADQNLTLGTLFSADAKQLIGALDSVSKRLNAIASAAKQLQTSMGSLNAATQKSSESYRTET